MVNLYVLDSSFNVIGVIDSYASLIWRPSYSEVGDFELYVGVTKELVDLLKVNRYLVRDTDVYVDAQGKATYTKVMIIKNHDLATSTEIGDYLTVTGRELKFILHQRIVWTQTNLTGTAENAIRTLVTQNAINPTDVKRKIPNLVLGDSANLTDTIEKQISNDPLDVVITDICQNYEYGWDISVYDGEMILTVYEGIDRSFDQNVIPYVVFSDSFENLYNTDYQLKTEDYANCTLVGGEGEGTARRFATVGGEKTGLDRFETFTNASDVSSNNGQIGTSQYTQLLQEKGNEALSQLNFTEGFSGEVLSDVAFKYGEDFDLGDLVTVINEYGISKNVRVLSAIESEDATGTKLLPQFNI